MAFEGGFALDADARTLRAAMTVPPPPGRLWQINQTIKQLKQHGIWQKLDVLWMMAAHDAQAGRLNWKAPASFALTAVNSPTFTADRGYAGNGTTSYLNTGWDPATNGVNYTQNNGSAFAWDRTARAGAAGAIMGVFDTGAPEGLNITPRFSDNNTYARINDDCSGVATTGSDGLFHADRTSTTARTVNRNGVALGSFSFSSSAMTAFDVHILAQPTNASPANFSTDQIAIVGIGGSLETQKGSLYNILNAHLRAVGAA